jgi:hypothetical protein
MSHGRELRDYGDLAEVFVSCSWRVARLSSPKLLHHTQHHQILR